MSLHCACDCMAQGCDVCDPLDYPDDEDYLDDEVRRVYEYDEPSVEEMEEYEEKRRLKLQRQQEY